MTPRRCRPWPAWRAAASALALVGVLSGHVGTLDTFFVGQAGPYRVQVTVRPPGVVPGLAQVTVRVDGGAAVTAVTTQAAQWNVGSRGAPAPDAAVRVPGDAALWSAQLWLMTRSSYAVHVTVDGSLGTGRVTVPVTNVATRTLGMTPGLGWILAALAAFLSVGLVNLVGAAARESSLAPGETEGAASRRRGRLAMVAGAAVLALALTGGRAWWNAVDAAYSRRLFRPSASQAEVARASDTGSPVIRVRIADAALFQGQLPPIVPDHGKLMHLFLVRADASGAMAHLHPVPRDSVTFEASAGDVSGGAYRYFADIVHESGFAQTLTGSLTVPEPNAAGTPLAADDAVYAGAPSDGEAHRLSDGGSVTWERPKATRPGGDLLLRFTVRERGGSVATLRPYLGMPGHAIVAHDDGGVFAHLHSNGSFSMASLQVIEAIERGDTLASRRPGAPRPRIDATDTHEDHFTSSGHLEFPFAFPRAGSYTVWVQFRRLAAVETVAFRATVDP
jgi:hypothetical protein